MDSEKSWTFLLSSSPEVNCCFSSKYYYMEPAPEAEKKLLSFGPLSFHWYRVQQRRDSHTLSVSWNASARPTLFAPRSEGVRAGVTRAGVGRHEPEIPCIDKVKPRSAFLPALRSKLSSTSHPLTESDSPFAPFVVTRMRRLIPHKKLSCPAFFPLYSLIDKRRGEK